MLLRKHHNLVHQMAFNLFYCFVCAGTNIMFLRYVYIMVEHPKLLAPNSLVSWEIFSFLSQLGDFLFSAHINVYSMLLHQQQG